MSQHTTAGNKRPQDTTDGSDKTTSTLREEIAKTAPFASGFDAAASLAGRYDNLRLGGDGE